MVTSVMTIFSVIFNYIHTNEWNTQCRLHCKYMHTHRLIIQLHHMSIHTLVPKSRNSTAVRRTMMNEPITPYVALGTVGSKKVMSVKTKLTTVIPMTQATISLESLNCLIFTL